MNLVALLTAVIVLEAYSAIIISFLTVNRIQLPFTDFEGLIGGEYKFGVAAYNIILFRVTISSIFCKSRMFNDYLYFLKTYKGEDLLYGLPNF